MPINSITIVGLLDGFFYLTSHWQKDMISLRVLSVASNVLFIPYGVLHANFEVTQHPGVSSEYHPAANQFQTTARNHPLNQAGRAGHRGITRLEWPLPHMYLKKYTVGEVLFQKGDKADEVIYVASGRLKRQEVDHHLGHGELIGGIGLFLAEKVRTITVICETDCEFNKITDEMIYRLYYKHPKLGFFFMRLIANNSCATCDRAPSSHNRV